MNTAPTTTTTTPPQPDTTPTIEVSPHRCEIVAQLPWMCGDKDCSVQWHLSSYWIDDEAPYGYTLDDFSDGDHEDVTEAQLPTPEQEQEAWRSYYQHVARTGEDPLGTFAVARKWRRKQRWSFDFRRTLAGWRLVSCRRHGGKWTRLKDVPLHVLDFAGVMQVMATGIGRLNPDVNTFINGRVGAGTMRYLWHDTIDVDVPRTAKAIERDLKRSARAAIKYADRRG